MLAWVTSQCTMPRASPVAPQLLVDDELPADDDEPDAWNVFKRAQSNMRVHWAPFAAAALVLVMGFTILSRERTAAWPELPLLRGTSGQTLSFPRGRVLAHEPSSTWSGFTSQAIFELAAVPGASKYWVVVTRHDGSAFATGTQLERIEGSEPVLATSMPLPRGNYTWQAWAVVDGLDKPLGSLDFEVVEQPELVSVVAGLERLRGVRLLHEAGFLTDARHIARKLPPSAERDISLETTPGR